MHMTHSLGINHIQGYKISLKKFNSIEIISSIFSDHNGTKLEINHRKGRKISYMETKQHATKKINGSTRKSKRKF